MYYNTKPQILQYLLPFFSILPIEFSKEKDVTEATPFANYLLYTISVYIISSACALILFILYAIKNKVLSKHLAYLAKPLKIRFFEGVGVAGQRRLFCNRPFWGKVIYRHRLIKAMPGTPW